MVKTLPRFILYLGSDSPGSTSRHRADALRRLGLRVVVVDPALLLGSRRRWQVFLDFHTGYRWLQRRLLNHFTHLIGGLAEKPDLIWVNGGELLGPDVLALMRNSFTCPILLYQNDDPTGSRDGHRFQQLLASLSLYDLCVLVRPETELEALARGASRVFRVLMSYDEVEHDLSPSMLNQDVQPIVSFAGTFIKGEKRDSFLKELHEAGLPLRLIGNRWQRSRHWRSLRSIYHGPSRCGPDYAQALGSVAVSLGLLSHHNRDLITTRSFEIPACGGLLCAERTSEHQLLYEQDREAVFWSSLSECVQQCIRLLAEPRRRAAIQSAGVHHVRRIGVGNEDICRQILALL